MRGNEQLIKTIIAREACSPTSEAPIEVLRFFFGTSCRDAPDHSRKLPTQRFSEDGQPPQFKLGGDGVRNDTG